MLVLSFHHNHSPMLMVDVMQSGAGLQQTDLGMGWEVGTTDTNLGQFAICSCTLEQDAMWDLILTRVT